MIKILLSIVSIGLVTCSNERNANAQTNSQARKVEWNTLKARWGPDPLTTDGESFVRQPRTVQQAQQERYEKLPTASGDSCVGKTTVGHRYWKQQDSGAILIYDKQGTISGIQLAFPQSAVDNQYYPFDRQTMFNREKINGTDMYTLTAYFVRPQTICTSGRTLSELEHQGTGTGLFLQNGSNPLQDVFEIPQWETDVAQTKWTRGACFKTMGVHYWYDNRIDTDCTRFLPAFLLYNRGQLSGFGWDIAKKLNFSRRTEYPPRTALMSFLVPVPTCLPKLYDIVGGFTTMHLYFNGDPANLDC